MVREQSHFVLFSVRCPCMQFFGQLPLADSSAVATSVRLMLIYVWRGIDLGSGSDVYKRRGI